MKELDEIRARLAAATSKTVHEATFGDILRTGWCTYYYGADNQWHNARTGQVIDDLEALEEERNADDEVSVWLTDSTPDLARLLAAVEAVEAPHRPSRREHVKYNGAGTLIAYTVTEDGPCIACQPEWTPTHCEDCDDMDCTGHGNSWHSWPCPTVTAITAALKETP